MSTISGLFFMRLIWSFAEGYMFSRKVCTRVKRKDYSGRLRRVDCKQRNDCK